MTKSQSVNLSILKLLYN